MSWTRSPTASSGSADGAYQSMCVVTGEGVIAVDAPPTLGNNILRAIARVTKNPITAVVYSHQHSDHVGAMSIYPADVPYYAHRVTAESLVALADPHRPPATRIFDDTLTIEAGDHSLRLDHPGPDDAEGNILIYAPEQRILMLVDVIFPGWVPFSNLALSANVPGFINAHEQALDYDFDTLVGGHVTRPGTPDDVRIQLDYMSDLRVVAEGTLSSVDLRPRWTTSTRERLGPFGIAPWSRHREDPARFPRPVQTRSKSVRGSLDADSRRPHRDAAQPGALHLRADREGLR